eukprot:1958924-Prymnesium_polylepis.1
MAALAEPDPLGARKTCHVSPNSPRAIPLPTGTCTRPFSLFDASVRSTPPWAPPNPRTLHAPHGHVPCPQVLRLHQQPAE